MNRLAISSLCFLNLEKNFISLGTTLIKKKVIKKFSGFDESDYFYGIEEDHYYLLIVEEKDL